jgi:hypothetical protein
MIRTSSNTGLTWSLLRDTNDCVMMHCCIFRLSHGSRMMAYTQRTLFYPISLWTVFSNDDGVTWQFDSDQTTIEQKTPWGIAQGGGFGNTVRARDGRLVSRLSYRGCDNKTRVEVIRWRLSSRSRALWD